MRRAKRYGRIRAGLNYFLYVQVMRLSPAEAEYALRNDLKITEYDHEEGEDRWKATFSTAALRVLFLIFTMRDDRIRVVTGWDADKKSAKEYFEETGL